MAGCVLARPSSSVGTMRFSCNSLFAFQTKIGLLFGQEETEDLAGGVSASRGAYGTFVDCATDACEFGIVVRDDCSLNFVGGDLWNHWGGLDCRASRRSYPLYWPLLQHQW